MLDLLPKRARLPVICAFLLPTILLILAAVETQRSAQRQVIRLQWVRHTREVEERLQEVSIYAARLMAGAHADADRTSLHASVQAVRELTRDNPAQQAGCGELEQRVGAYLEGPAALTPQSLAPVDEVTSRLRSAEAALMQSREETLVTGIKRRTAWLWTLVLLNAGLLAGVLYLVRKMMRLENFVNICAWSRTIEYKGEWISFEKYLERRFGINTSHGISPEEAERVFSELKGRESTDGVRRIPFAP